MRQLEREKIKRKNSDEMRNWKNDKKRWKGGKGRRIN